MYPLQLSMGCRLIGTQNLNKFLPQPRYEPQTSRSSTWKHYTIHSWHNFPYMTGLLTGNQIPASKSVDTQSIIFLFKFRKKFLIWLLITSFQCTISSWAYDNHWTLLTPTIARIIEGRSAQVAIHEQILLLCGRWWGRNAAHQWGTGLLLLFLHLLDPVWIDGSGSRRRLTSFNAIIAQVILMTEGYLVTRVELLTAQENINWLLIKKSSLQLNQRHVE